MSKKKIIGLAIFAALLCGGWYGYTEYTRKVTDLSEVKADMSLNASELISAFQANEAQSNADYLDKIIMVNGIVREVERNDHGHFTVVLGEDMQMSSVRCSMDSSYQDKIAELTKGSRVMIKGACTGFNSDELLGSDVILNRCVISPLAGEDISKN